MGEDVLVECLLQQLLDEVLLAGGALYVGAVAHAVAGSRVLGGAQAVKLVQALRKIESGVGVLHVGGAPRKSTTMKFWMFRPVSELTAFTVQLAADARLSPVV